MEKQLQINHKYPHTAKAIVNEIFDNQKFIFIKNHKPTNVGEYFKKHKDKCLKKFQNT